MLMLMYVFAVRYGDKDGNICFKSFSDFSQVKMREAFYKWLDYAFQNGFAILKVKNCDTLVNFKN